MIVEYSAPPASAPDPRLTARSMLSLGTEDFLAFWMASYSVGLPVMSPPPIRAATSMFLTSLANIFPRRESMMAFLCLVVAHLECPDMTCVPFAASDGRALASGDRACDQVGEGAVDGCRGAPLGGEGRAHQRPLPYRDDPTHGFA